MLSPNRGPRPPRWQQAIACSRARPQSPARAHARVQAAGPEPTRDLNRSCVGFGYAIKLFICLIKKQST